MTLLDAMLEAGKRLSKDRKWVLMRLAPMLMAGNQEDVALFNQEISPEEVEFVIDRCIQANSTQLIAPIGNAHFGKN